jgi:hypothetical protein
MRRAFNQTTPLTLNHFKRPFQLKHLPLNFQPAEETLNKNVPFYFASG